ncbi:hypothetical protein O9G_004439 [Rozella allomycis CSF55]|uniref:Chitin-binding type-4 domain-containing protein n=1 Tax=Rozella allomycis (strain CSF55) TaxID=988480 RepID=A0A075AYQ4_ROZAC|nr:hypothetical protein O9G_004439 [Rozella allomycis CSF55]|eukprot:EPZ33847.1 hypothetical protein O9G_004439 [Rozella allomycis CSF55]
MTSPPSRPGTTNSPAQSLCQGVPAGSSPTTVQAGSPLQVSISGEAVHGGGGCLFSISYDGGNSFTVLSVTDKQCPIQRSFSVQIPANAPNGKAVFAWSWIPVLSGQPEYYMNCADIVISGGSTGGSIAGPSMPIYNMPGAPTVYAVETKNFIGLSDIIK